MTSHLGVLMLFAAFVSAVFGVLLRDTGGEQLRFAGRTFALLVGGAWLVGWLMYFAF